jgi:predicted ATPase
LAWHSEQAGRYLDAANFGITAAETYASRSAIQEADLLLSIARRNLEKCKSDPVHEESLLRLLMIQGVVTSNLHGIGSSATRKIYEEGIQLCTRRDPDDREKWFPIYWGYWFTAPDFKTQLERANLIIGDLESSKDSETTLQALHCGWATAFNTGRHQECLARIAAGLSYYDADRAISSRYRYGHDAKACGLGEKALVEWLIGKDDLASKSIAECLDWANATDHLGSRCHALDMAIILEYYRRNIDRVAALAVQMQTIAETFSFPGLEAKAMIFGGWAMAMDGAVGTGIERVERGLDLQQRIGTSEDFPLYYEILASLWGVAGRVNDAVLSLDVTIERANAAGHLFWLAELYRRRASLRLSRGDDVKSIEAELDLAKREAERQGAVALLDRISVDQNSLYA